MRIKFCCALKRGGDHCSACPPLSGTTDLCGIWHFDRETDNGWWLLVLWSLTLLKASHKCKGMSFCAVLCASLAADLSGSLKLLASCTSPDQQLPAKLEAISCLSAYLKSGTARRTPEGACTDPKSPSLFPGLDWDTGLHPCLGICSYVPADVLPVTGNCVCASDNCMKLAEFGVGKRICHQELQSLKSSAVERAFYSCCVQKDFLVSKQKFIHPFTAVLGSQGAALSAGVSGSTAGASCALLLSPSQVLRDSLQGGSMDSSRRIFCTFPLWEVSLCLSWVGFHVQRAPVGMFLFLLNLVREFCLVRISL